MYSLLFHGRSLWAVYSPLSHVVISEKKGKQKKRKYKRLKNCYPLAVFRD